MLAKRFAGIEQQVYQNFREVAALHQEGREGARKFFNQFDAGRQGTGKNLLAGPLDFLDDLQLFDPALA